MCQVAVAAALGRAQLVHAPKISMRRTVAVPVLAGALNANVLQDITPLDAQGLRRALANNALIFRWVNFY